jgi:hypothetical protein
MPTGLHYHLGPSRWRPRWERLRLFGLRPCMRMLLIDSWGTLRPGRKDVEALTDYCLAHLTEIYSCVETRWRHLNYRIPMVRLRTMGWKDDCSLQCCSICRNKVRTCRLSTFWSRTCASELQITFYDNRTRVAFKRIVAYRMKGIGEVVRRFKDCLCITQK